MEDLNVAVERLQREHDSVKSELSLLRSCLVNKRLILDSDVHRAGFEQVKKRTWTPGVESIEQVMEAVAGNWPWWGDLRLASKRLYQSVAAAEKRYEVCLCVAGGWDGSALTSAELYRRNEGKGSWTQLPAMPVARYGHSGAVVDGSLYVCGGKVEHGHSSSVQKLDLCGKEAAWQPVAPMRQRRYQPVAMALDRTLYVCGGDDGGSVLESLECLKPGASEWEAMPSMSQKRYFFAGVSLNRQLLVFGGAGDLAGASAEAFGCPSGFGCWRPLPPMPMACREHCAVAMAGKAFVCGGEGAGAALTGAVQVYDPKSNSWSMGPAMIGPRSGHAAAVLGSDILIFGGKGKGLENSVQGLPGASEGASWSPLTSLSRRRKYCCAVALPCFGVEH